MFTITHDSRTHSYQSSSPERQCLRTTDASSLAHQVTDSSSHSFYCPCGGWQMELPIFPARSEMIDPSEELAHDHAHDTQFCCLAFEISQLLDHDFQTGTIGEIESWSGKLIESFAQRSAGQSAISSASAVLQSTDEMKMAELNNPALALAEPDDSSNFVGDRGPDASVDVNGDRGDCLRPAPQVLPAHQEHRIEEHSLISMARLDRHQIQHPISSSKSEVKSVQEQSQRSCWQAQLPRSRYQLSQRSAKTATQSLRGKAIARCHTLQRSSLHQDCFQKSGRSSPRVRSSFLSADAPRPFAKAALATARTEAVNFRSATWRFRVQQIHARELSTDSYSKYAKSQANYV